MLDQVELILLKKGDPVNHYLLLKKCEIRTTKTNKKYLTIELGDRSSNIGSNMWDNFEQVYAQVKCGEVVKVKGIIEEYLGTPQIKIISLKTVDPLENISPADFLAKSKRGLNEMTDEFKNRIEKISNSKLKELIKLIFTEENFKKYSSVPAGKAWHHAYIHGLMEHTLEIIKICDLMCDIHPEINRDLLISGAMMHDYGKVEELSFDTGFEYTDKGKLIGHIVIAAMAINDKAKEIPDFPEDLKDCLLHTVLSHQGKLEYASPVVPKTLEAITLYQADELSAKVNAYKNALASETKVDSKWTKFLQLASTDLYNHGILPDEDEGIRKSLFD
jgi:3'-5' exoribonuclease